MNVRITPRTPPNRTILHTDVSRIVIFGDELLVLEHTTPDGQPTLDGSTIRLADCKDVHIDTEGGAAD